MFSLDGDAKEHVVIVSLLKRKLEFLLLPSIGHLREPDQAREHLHFDNVVLGELEAQRLAVECFIGV